MTTKPSCKVFRFRNRVDWESGRHGAIHAADKPTIEISRPPQFNGQEGVWSPEDLFLATVNVCLMQTFMEYALRTNLGLISYESAAEGVLERAEGRYRFTEFHLQPVIVVKSEEDAGRAAKILDSAESACLISNSVRATVKVSPEFVAQSVPATESRSAHLSLT
jgi:organic hydroperoxide reductase OsmC/OhrA